MRSEQQVALCRLHLLEELMELQEVQASALVCQVSRGSHSVPSKRFPALIKGFSVFGPSTTSDAQRGQTLQQDRDSQVNISALQLLVTGSHETLGSAAVTRISTEPSRDGEARSRASNCELVEVLTLSSDQSPSVDQRAEGGHDICTGAAITHI